MRPYQERYLKAPVLEDLRRKMVFVGGPRQVGKTAFSLNLAPARRRYLNWDILEDRKFALKQRFPVEKFIIFDEIHKFKKWRGYVKGLYDKYSGSKKILVTGSARLDFYRHSGDSLQGRYHHYRLHPFTVKEIGAQTPSDMRDLLALGGFPEPFLSGSQRHALRWSKEYKSRAVYEEIPSLELSRGLSLMELALLRLPELVGSPLSINNLREDVEIAHKTAVKYLDIFERMYLIYRLPPFGSPLLRAVKKEQKHYHYNWAEVPGEAARFECLIAGHLLKWVHFQQDYEGRDVRLCYFRDTDKREVDFVIAEGPKPIQAIERKLQARDISPGVRYFKGKFPHAECVQVHLKGKKEYVSQDGIHALSWRSFLNRLI